MTEIILSFVCGVIFGVIGIIVIAVVCDKKMKK